MRFTRRATPKRSWLGGELEQKAHRGNGAAVGGTIFDVADELALEVVPVLLVEAVRRNSEHVRR